MSARICGCDPEQDYICEEHRERPTAREHADFMQQLDQWKTNLAAVDPLVAQQQRIARVLATFYRAPVSISSLQPLLDLAVELNPGINEPR